MREGFCHDDDKTRQQVLVLNLALGPQPACFFH